MRVLAALLVSSPLLAQAVSLGLRGGFPITPMVASGGGPSSLRYAVGPLVEVHLWRGAGFGADFLLARDGLAASPAGSRRAQVWRWEAPVTFVYRFGAPPRPFVRAGVSLNRVFHIGGSPAAELRHRGTSGFVAGGGLRFKCKTLWLEPEVRLTRWIDRNFGVRDSAVRSNLNQVALLLAVVF